MKIEAIALPNSRTFSTTKTNACTTAVSIVITFEKCLENAAPNRLIAPTKISLIIFTRKLNISAMVCHTEAALPPLLNAEKASNTTPIKVRTCDTTGSIALKIATKISTTAEKVLDITLPAAERIGMSIPDNKSITLAMPSPIDVQKLCVLLPPPPTKRLITFMKASNKRCASAAIEDIIDPNMDCILSHALTMEFLNFSECSHIFIMDPPTTTMAPATTEAIPATRRKPNATGFIVVHSNVNAAAIPSALPIPIAIGAKNATIAVNRKVNIPTAAVILGFISFILTMNSPTLIAAFTITAATSPQISTNGDSASAQVPLNCSHAIPRGRRLSTSSFTC